jgi:polyphenol oxidase
MSYLSNSFRKIELGYIFEDENVIVFFGNKKASFEGILAHFSKYKFHKIRQTHSDIVIEQNDFLTEADSHFTSRKNSGLLISTADCLPVMIRCLQTNRVAAVHAGWKGVANQIVLKTIQKLIDTGSSSKEFDFWIGPHIKQEGFEIEVDVYETLAASSYQLAKEDFTILKKNKYYVNLTKIVASQINHILIIPPQIYILPIDTKTNSDFWSFRRDKQNAGRNLSFIISIRQFYN